MSIYVDPIKSNYIGLINESEHTNDDQDIGDLFAINKSFLVVKNGYPSSLLLYSNRISRGIGW